MEKKPNKIKQPMSKQKSPEKKKEPENNTTDDHDHSQNYDVDALEPPDQLRASSKKVYKSIKGDQVDEFVAALFNSKNLSMPIYRIGEGKYLIGTESRMVLIKGTTCVVRVGGGFENLEEYLLRNEA